MKKPKVFLGGTCNNSNWRDKLIKRLEIEYFNPVVEDWTPECQAEEIVQREACDYCLYVITPEMVGVYSVAEAVDDSNKRPTKTVFCYLPEVDGVRAFGRVEIKSLEAVGDMVKKNGSKFFKSLEEVADFLNTDYLIPRIKEHKGWSDKVI